MKAEKEAGIEPRKIKEHIEDGTDACGGDSPGLSKDILNYLGDVMPEDFESNDGDDANLSVSLPPRLRDANADEFSIAQSLCYGTNNCRICVAAKEARQNYRPNEG